MGDLTPFFTGHYTLAAGTGTYGYEPKVSYFFGIPRAILPGGAVMNIPIVHIAGEDRNDPDRKRDFLFQVGLISSALEHAVPERMFTNDQNPGEAISAVKALQKANAQGQRIYHITPDNRGGTLSQIHHTPFVMEEIRNALNAGKEVITHTDAVSVPGWTGAGYILFDPHTGDGAFKIGGGMNGGALVFGASAMGVIGMFLLVNGVGPAILAAILIPIAIHAAIIGLSELIAEGLITPEHVFAGSAGTLSLMHGLAVLLAGLGVSGFTVPGGVLMGVVLVALATLGFTRIGR